MVPVRSTGSQTDTDAVIPSVCASSAKAIGSSPKTEQVPCNYNAWDWPSATASVSSRPIENVSSMQDSLYSGDNKKCINEIDLQVKSDTVTYTENDIISDDTILKNFDIE